MQKIPARRFRLHEIPEYDFEWVEITIPSDLLYKQKYDPHINFQEEQQLYAVAFLGRGGNGEAWFAITEDGERCGAIKFFYGAGSTEDLAQAERKNWETVYGDDEHLPKCHVGKLASGTAYLCMPYINPIPPRLRSIMMDFTPECIEEAFDRFVKAGLKQGSIRWEHLGFFPIPKAAGGNSGGDDGETTSRVVAMEAGGDDEPALVENPNEQKLYVFDLGRMESFQEGENPKDWITAVKETLSSSVPPPGPFDMNELAIEGHFREHLYKNN